jgi:hypothetical protein
MKRLLLAIAASYLLGVAYALAAVVTPLPVTLTIHANGATYTVQSMYSSMVFGAGGAIALDYTSDRIFCSDFTDSSACWERLP